MSTEFLITSLVVVLIPGTGVLYTVSAGLFIGARAAVFAAIGCTFGILPSLLASILGLAVVIHSSALAFQVIKYIGVAYLLYLSWSMWKNSNALALKKEKSDERLFSVMIKGFLINILNPKLTLFFLAFIPQFLSSNSSSYTSEMLVLGLIFMLMTLVVFILYGLLATSVREYLINSEKISKYIQRVFAGTFALLGLKLAFTDR
ncbi:LysE family translocator [Halarcobacter ebronensis]|uniref:Lysine transporter LysE n=1 Tax=Halarcobacter ebronensis TaxID=1462615 RepID=A0A4Q1AZI8_9BACT|nr:LysE family translocator [Halarcobacter ebronensis]QKF82354.1 transporter, LysE family [Halarcobacter ebronensis]RXK07618.1 lysine transporter LysE [Halarcobacter ebronensis]